MADPEVYKRLVADEPNLTRPTLKAMKSALKHIDDVVYGGFINKATSEQKRNVQFIITDEIEGDSSVRLRKGNHFIYINPNAFEEIEEDKLALLQRLIQSESVVIALDLYLDVKRSSDRPYDLFGLRRKCSATELFGEYLHSDRIPSSEQVWFETPDGTIVEGKVVDNVKDKQLTIVKTKDGEEYTVSDDTIYGTSREDFYVQKQIQ